MPIYEQSYRSYDGTLRGRFRWMTIVQQEYRVITKSRLYRLLMLAALLYFAWHLLLLLVFDIVQQDPNSELGVIFEEIPLFNISSSTFYSYIQSMGALVFLVVLFAGSGMICNDFNNNLMEIYFSKPITWLDYALGKILTLVFIGLSITALPAIFLVLMHNLLLPGMSTFKESYWWPLPILAFSLLVVVPSALGVLASSALMRSKNFAAVAVFMILIADSAMGGMLAGLLRDEEYLILSFPIATNRVGQHFFRESQTLFDTPWYWSFGLILGVCAICLWVIFRRIRRAEIAA